MHRQTYISFRSFSPPDLFAQAFPLSISRKLLECIQLSGDNMRLRFCRFWRAGLRNLGLRRMLGQIEGIWDHLTFLIFFSYSFSIISSSFSATVSWYSSCLRRSRKRLSSLLSYSMLRSFSFLILSRASTLLSLFSISCSSCSDLFLMDQSYSSLRYFSSRSNLAMLSLRRDLVSSSLEISRFWRSIFSCASLIFFCFSLRFMISLFIFLGSRSSKAFRLRSTTIRMPLSPLSESRFPPSASPISVQFFCSRSTYIFSYFSETQLSEARKCRSSGIELMFSIRCMKPLSETLQPEKSSRSRISPAVDSRRLSTSSITPSSASRFLLRLRVRRQAQLTIVTRDLTPSCVIQFEERFSTFRFSMLLSMKLNTCSMRARPRSPIAFPRRFTSSNSELTAPSKKVSAPSASSSLNSRLILRRLRLASTYLRRVGPTDDLMKFLPRSSATRLSPLRRMYSAPSVLMRFSASLSSLSCLFFLRGIEMISAPFMPMSLSSSSSTSRALFWRRMAARQRAPSTPKEFLRIEPSQMPKFKLLRCPFFMSSSRMRERPTSLIILLARLRRSRRVLLRRFLTACMPYSEMELSARLSSVKYLWVSRMAMSFMMVFTPRRIEFRLSTCGNFLELTLLRLSLNILAFSRSGFSPVSWQREKKISAQAAQYLRGTPARRWMQSASGPPAVRPAASTTSYSYNKYHANSSRLSCLAFILGAAASPSLLSSSTSSRQLEWAMQWLTAYTVPKMAITIAQTRITSPSVRQLLSAESFISSKKGYSTSQTSLLFSGYSKYSLQSPVVRQRPLYLPVLPASEVQQQSSSLCGTMSEEQAELSVKETMKSSTTKDSSASMCSSCYSSTFPKRSQTARSWWPQRKRRQPVSSMAQGQKLLCCILRGCPDSRLNWMSSGQVRQRWNCVISRFSHPPIRIHILLTSRIALSSSANSAAMTPSSRSSTQSILRQGSTWRMSASKGIEFTVKVVREISARELFCRSKRQTASPLLPSPISISD